MDHNVSVEANGRTTAEDLRDLWSASRIRFLLWLLFAAGIFYGYLVFAEAVNEGFSARTAFTIIPYGAATLMTLSAPFLVPRMRSRAMLRTSPLLRESRRYVFSSEGVQVVSDLAKCSYQWRAFYKVGESRKSFLLFHAPLYALIVPKRFFAATEDVARARHLIRTNFKGKHGLST